METATNHEEKLGSTINLTRDMQGEALVMMVDDEALVIELTQAFLEDAGYKRFVHTTQAPEAIAIMLRERPHVVLLDINMPHMNGFQILERMRANPLLQYVPVIVLTSADDPDTKLKALELGASDFLRKPVDASELVLRMRNILAAKAYHDFLAYYDRGTGLINRQRFLGELERTLLEADTAARMGALLHIGLDRFKQINEALGPVSGDEVIGEVSRRLRGTLQAQAMPGRRRGDKPFAGRMSGTEFAVLLPMISNQEHPARVAEELLRALARPCQVGGKDLHVTASIGVALFPADASQLDDLVKNAAAALQEAKSAGGNSCRFYSKELNVRAVQRLNVEEELRRALERGELRLFYQPKFLLASNEMNGAEALMRWQHPERGLVAPNDFIPVAEESGLIVPLGDWALNAACRQMQEWGVAGLRRVPVAVNVSPRQFRPELSGVVGAAVAATGQADFLHLELTESSLMGNPTAAISMLGELRDLGMRLSIDDFGTGYSSLSYLHLLPLHELKIDRSFIATIVPGKGEAVLVDVIIAMAHSLGLTVVAEGVETQHQLDYLRAHGCDECQGYFFSKPLPATEFAEKYLRGA
ncbi:MAG: EAL domain-containing protein [Betaproteobacteria bacterium]|nr:EAL domain-containing protein [Betaproteobacteria bacterium]